MASHGFKRGRPAGGGAAGAAEPGAAPGPRKRTAVSAGPGARPQDADVIAEQFRKRGEPLLDTAHPCLSHLSPDQRRLPEAIAARKHVFLTGRAGSGKSTAIVATLEALKAAGTRFAVSAASGIAAVPLGGTTVHALLCLRDDNRLDVCQKAAARYRPELRTLQVLIIDEASMVSGSNLARIVHILRHVRRGGDLPVLVIVGDFFQLPPVNGEMMFEHVVWRELDPLVIDLPTSFRQRGDAAFLTMLDEVRVGTLSDASRKMLEARVGVDLVTEDGVRPTFVSGRRDIVGRINAEELGDLVTEDTPLRTFPAKVRLLEFVKSGAAGAATATATAAGGTWVVSPRATEALPEGCKSQAGIPEALRGADILLPADKAAWRDVEIMVGNMLTPVMLNLCVGAQVVFTANVNPPFIVNGTRGKVTHFTDEGFPVVALCNKRDATHVARPYRFTKRVDAAESTGPTYAVEQIPLQTAWALTIHKSQGMSMDKIQIDLGPSVFSEGMAYVALSRATTLAGITLTAFDPRSIRAKASVVEWAKAQEAASV